MAYPFPGFGSFVFQREEWPIDGTDSGWRRSPVRDRTRNLGSAIDSIVTLAVGSAERSWEAHLEPARLAALEELISSTEDFVDWNRPTPEQRRAYLENVEPIRNVAAREFVSDDNPTRRKTRVRISIISQE